MAKIHSPDVPTVYRILSRVECDECDESWTFRADAQEQELFDLLSVAEPILHMKTTGHSFSAQYLPQFKRLYQYWTTGLCDLCECYNTDCKWMFNKTICWMCYEDLKEGFPHARAPKRLNTI